MLILIIIGIIVSATFLAICTIHNKQIRMDKKLDEILKIIATTTNAEWLDLNERLNNLLNQSGL